MMHGGWHGFGGLMGMGGYGWIGLALNLTITIGLIVGLILVIIWLIRRLRSEGPGVSTPMLSGPSPKEILQARYVRGEIDREQYQQMLSDLG